MSLYPKINEDNIIDNPLLPRVGTPVTKDDFVDHSERILNATGSNLLHQTTNGRLNNNQEIHYVDSSKFFNNKVNPSNKIDLNGFNIEFNHSIPTPSLSDNGLPYQIHNSNSSSDPNSLNTSTNDLIYDIDNNNTNNNNKKYNIIDGINDTSKRIYFDIINNTVSKETFTDNNNLYYIGIILLILGLILFLIFYFIDNNKKCNCNIDNTFLENDK